MVSVAALRVLMVLGNSPPNDIEKQCSSSVTTASGPDVIGNGNFCSGQLIFEDNFDNFDQNRWQHEINMGGGGNGEFQWYVNDRKNSFTENGVLHLKPTLTSDVYGEKFLSEGTVDLGRDCTSDFNNGCKRTGTPDHILNPVRSARVRTKDSFSFKYGRVEVRAKLPAGDWLWPAIWLLPTRSAYGIWPRSGEIDLMESRGNRHLTSSNGVPIGPQQSSATLHFGPDWTADAWYTAHTERNAPSGQGFNQDFHCYQMEWTPDRITFKMDNVEMATFPVGDGYWARGDFAKRFPHLKNPWENASINAPFDQEFHFVFNTAIGGTNSYFPDNASNPDMKPWANNSPHPMNDFWNGRNAWLKTWNYDDSKNSESNLQIDYVRVWAL